MKIVAIGAKIIYDVKKQSKYCTTQVTCAVFLDLYGHHVQWTQKRLNKIFGY